MDTRHRFHGKKGNADNDTIFTGEGMMNMRGKILWSTAFIVAVGLDVDADYNYGEALQKALYFYECQQSGPLPGWNRVEWRGPSCLNDGKDVGVDLTGGWYDAGDHVKFNFPMSASVTILAWGGIVYRDAYIKGGQYEVLQNNLRFVCDYLMRCHTADNEFWGQVGNGGLDHAFWGPAESVEAQMKRPSYKIDAAHPGADLAGEAAAALAACCIIFKESDAAYSQKLLSHARKLYTFADTHRGKYPAAIPDAQGYYNSFSGYYDEIVWGACWLYLATQEAAYLQKAEKEYDSLLTEPQMPEKQFKWTIAWDDKSYGCYVLLAQITGKEMYHADAQRWLDFWTVGYKGEYKIKYTPGGLAWLDTWGANRYACNTGLVAMIYSDKLEDATLKKRYHDFAAAQIRYTLGDNPLKRSMVVGYGKNPPVRPHHRTCEGSYPGDASDTVTSVHTLYGALVGGPGSDDSYKDERNNYINNEVACDYNAAFTGLLARMYQEYGGDPLAVFPPKEPRKAEFWVEASTNASGTRFTEIRSVIKNKSLWPARIAKTLKFRYYVDLSEATAAGIAASAVTVSTNYLQGPSTKVSQLVQLEGSVYYTEIDLTGETLYPGTQDSYKREVQFRISLPDTAPDQAWDPSNDWSYENMGTGFNQTAPIVNIPVYLDGKQVFGAEYKKPPVDPTAISTMRPAAVQRSGAAWLSLAAEYGCTRLLVRGTVDRIGNIEIWTLSGRVMVRRDVASLPARIDITSFPPGLYLVRMRGANGFVAQRTFTVQR
jgi:endoglucanase